MKRTQDNLGQAKTQLMRTLREAENEGAPAAMLRKIERLCADAEALQRKIETLLSKKR